MKLREDLAAAVAEAHRLASTRTLWPQWDSTGTPLVLHSQELSYIVGHPTPPEGYVELEPVAGRHVHMGPTLPEMAANTAREMWSHQRTCEVFKGARTDKGELQD